MPSNEGKQRFIPWTILMGHDGSAEFVSTVGWIGGWGCCSADGWEKASYPPPPTCNKQSIVQSYRR